MEPQENDVVALTGEEDFSFDPNDSDILSLGLLDFRDTEGLEYPALMLSNVLFTDSLKVLKAYKRPSYRTMDVWIELPEDGGYEHIGSMQVDSELLLVLRHLQIAATLYFDHDNFQALDLNNPEVLEKFI